MQNPKHRTDWNIVSDFEVDFDEAENRDDLDQEEEQNEPASCPAFNYYR